MNWGIEDFVAAAAIFAGIAVGIVLVRRNVGTQPWRGILIAGVVLAATAVWAHLAVGIF